MVGAPRKDQGGQGSRLMEQLTKSTVGAERVPCTARALPRPRRGWTTKPLKPKLEMNIPEARGDRQVHSPALCVGDRGQANPGSATVQPEPLPFPGRWGY